MPTFRTRQPRSIGQTIAAMLSSSGRLSAGDRAEVELKAGRANREDALAEKARLEVESAREADRARRDPDMAARYAGSAAGLDEPTSLAYGRFNRGAEEPLASEVDDEGNPMPRATYARPEGVSPDQERTFRSSIAATIANLLATGRTNAEQLTKAGGNVLLDSQRLSAAGEASPAVQNQRMAPWRPTAREPYRTNAQGTVLNEETGALDESGSIAQATRAAVQALGTERRAHAGLHSTRAGDIVATQPGRIERTGAAADADRARAETTRQPVARPAPGRSPEKDALDREAARKRALEATKMQMEQSKNNFAADPDMKGRKLGRWVDGQGFQVLDKAGKLIGYYD